MFFVMPRFDSVLSETQAQDTSWYTQAPRRHFLSMHWGVAAARSDLAGSD